ncbi:unnamed protein product [Sphenostylis stenocarpa]|uniref:Uncharacterized protein n=1 Tax=Sphenostylis stenocarpa TaxID=92480 RepID=A0AA86W459_9FABA|nr:unnamed protein product [Sphenostylis stenocarpa]
MKCIKRAKPRKVWWGGNNPVGVHLYIKINVSLDCLHCDTLMAVYMNQSPEFNSTEKKVCEWHTIIYDLKETLRS